MKKKIVNHVVVTQNVVRSDSLLAAAGERHEAKSTGHFAATHGFRLSKVTDNRYDIWDGLHTSNELTETL